MSGLFHLTRLPNSEKGRAAKVKDGLFQRQSLRNYLSLSTQIEQYLVLYLDLNLFGFLQQNFTRSCRIFKGLRKFFKDQVDKGDKNAKMACCANKIMNVEHNEAGVRMTHDCSRHFSLRKNQLQQELEVENVSVDRESYRERT